MGSNWEDDPHAWMSAVNALREFRTVTDLSSPPPNHEFEAAMVRQVRRVLSDMLEKPDMYLDGSESGVPPERHQSPETRGKLDNSVSGQDTPEQCHGNNSNNRAQPPRPFIIPSTPSSPYVTLPGGGLPTPKTSTNSSVEAHLTTQPSSQSSVTSTAHQKNYVKDPIQFEHGLVARTDINIAVGQWQCRFRHRNVQGTGFTCMYRAIAYCWTGNENAWESIQQRTWQLWCAVMRGPNDSTNPARQSRRVLYERLAMDDPSFIQLMKVGEWGQIETVQVVADAFDIEIFVYEISASGWGVLTRGQNHAPERQIHIACYQNIKHWTALIPASDHFKQGRLPPIHSRAPLGLELPDALPRLEINDPRNTNLRHEHNPYYSYENALDGHVADMRDPFAEEEGDGSEKVGASDSGSRLQIPAARNDPTSSMLSELYGAHEILHAMSQDKTKVKALHNKAYAPKLERKRLKKDGTPSQSTTDMLEFMSQVLHDYYHQELSQAQAAADNTSASLRATRGQPAINYCTKPAILSGTFNVKSSLGHLKQVTHTSRTAALREVGLDMWVMDIIGAIKKHHNMTRKADDIAITELVLAAIGWKFPQGYPKKVTQAVLDDNEVEFIVEKTTDKNNKSIYDQWRNRRVRYYKCMARLRASGLQYVGLSQVENLFKVLSDTSDANDLLIPWARLFLPVAVVASKRAWAGMKGDFTGRAELLSKSMPGSLLRHLKRSESWHNYRPCWATIGDARRWNEMHYSFPPGSLRSPVADLKYGFAADANNNLSWSVWLRDVDGKVSACASTHIPRGCFIGFLPGECFFRPTEDLPTRVFEGPEPGLFFNDAGQQGLLASMERTDCFAKGNIIAGWQPYPDNKAPKLTSFSLVLFSYRPITPCQPLILWEHLRTDDASGSESS